MPLPRPQDRWTATRKRALLRAIDAGEIARDRAAEAYAISDEELASWRRRFGRFGPAGLKATQLQELGR